MEFKIGKLAEVTGINVDTLRYYEKRGLVQPVERRRSGYRIYNDESIKEVEFVKRAQALGFSLPEIRKIIEIDKHTGSIDDVLEFLRNKSRELKKRLSDTARITRALNIIEAKCSCGDGKSFTDLLFSDYADQITHTHALKNTYLLEEGEWNINGHATAADGTKLDVVGISKIIHEEKIWTVRNDFVIGGGPVSTVLIHVPPIVNESEVSRYIGNCCLYGEVKGRIVLSDNSVYKCYDMPEFEYRGFEHLKKLSDVVYDVSGCVTDEEINQLQWEYRLERTEASVPSS